MRGAGLFFFLFFLLLIFGAIGWVVFTRVKAQRAGLPPPSWKSYIPFMKKSSTNANYPTPRSTGPVEWIRDQIDKLRNRRSGRGAYEESRGEYGAGGGGGGYSRAAGGPLAGKGARGRTAEDDAWDTQVHHDDPYGTGPGGYGHEEAELGLASASPGVHTEPYGSDYVHSSQNYGYQQTGVAERGRPGPASHSVEDPFGDQHEAASLRDVSPRPEASKGHSRNNSAFEDPHLGTTSGTRKSHFTEAM